ncbi:MAG TPA: glycosyltransferase [Isosphaeraceae bacterium]|jgi:glycosyltransferase involved in cell wall biosynthesis|nr:glycosyltransferase [Isosphaeraceae bacterium]
MEPSESCKTNEPVAGSRRPFRFLVSTTGWARGIHNNLGSAAYSYYFVLEALAPLLEKYGTWQLVERPESRLPYLAAKAAAEDFRPVHLALNPPQDVYLSPAVPTIVFPFWEFPDIPDRDFGTDTRQNWLRVCRSTDMIITACKFTADAFRREPLQCPVAVVPVPLEPVHFELPDWDLSHTWTLDCRHLVWGGESANVVDGTDLATPQIVESPSLGEAPVSWKRRVWLMARAGYRRIVPWLGPWVAHKIARVKHLVFYALGRSPITHERLLSGRPSPGKLIYVAFRSGYRRHVRRWLSDDARQQLDRAREAILRLLGREPVVVIDPLLPSGPLTLGGGVVYTTIFNFGDPRKNWLDLLSAFLIAFRDRPEVTLVIKMVTNPVREHHEVGLLRQRYEELGLRHKCRVAVMTEYLSAAQMAELMKVTTYYVNTSHAEGACLPLQQALAGGRPGLAPAHSAMADYMDDSVGFVLQSHAEPSPWPHDPERRLETYWHRLVWSHLRDTFIASASVADHDHTRYAAMATAARDRMRAYAGREKADAALREALAQLPPTTLGAFAWAS